MSNKGKCFRINEGGIDMKLQYLVFVPSDNQGYHWNGGIDSPAGCGSNSKYWTKWTITRLP